MTMSHYFESMVKWHLVSEPDTVSPTAAFNEHRVYHPHAPTTVFLEKKAALRKEIPDYREREPITAFMSELREKISTTLQARAAYRGRIAELKKDAALDGISMNHSSEREFWTFLGAQGFFRKGALFLLDNGNLRAVWKNKGGDQIGLQFLGNKTIQYVMFKHRNPLAKNISRVAGRDTLDGVRRQILALDLADLLCS